MMYLGGPLPTLQLTVCQGNLPSRSLNCFTVLSTSNSDSVITGLNLTPEPSEVGFRGSVKFLKLSAKFYVQVLAYALWKNFHQICRRIHEPLNQ